MTATPCAHRVLKDVLAGGANPGAAQGTLLAAGADVLRPAYEPVLLVGLDLAWTAEQASGDPAGLQLIDDAGGAMVYVNLEPREAAAVRRRRLLLVLEPPAAGGASRRLVYTDGRGGHQEIARIERRGGSFGVAGPRPTANGARRFFVGGAPKSGTTWVEEILNAHPDVLCTGEGAFFEPADRAALAGILRRRVDRSWQPADRSDRFAVDLLCAGAARNLLDQHAAVGGVAVVGDKTPANARFYDAIVACFPDALLVHCVRHPLDVCVSRAYHERNLFRDGRLADLLVSPEQGARLEELLAAGTPAPGELFGDGDLLRLLLDDWIAHNEPFLDLAAELPDRFTLVRYEDLKADPRSAARLFAFLGRPLSPAELDEVLAATSFAARAGRAAGQEDAGAFLRKGVVGDHVQHVSDDQRAQARTHLGELPALFGYDL